MMSLVFDWIKSQGGPSAMEENRNDKAKAMYDTIDHSQGFYV